MKVSIEASDNFDMIMARLRYFWEGENLTILSLNGFLATRLMATLYRLLKSPLVR
jgi:hypothetical protein